MNIEKFVELRPFLYHLTDERNILPILQNKVMNSTVILARMGEVSKLDHFLRTRRVGHFEIRNGEFNAILRDQDPLFEKIVNKNLVGGWTFEDFIYSLNSRVFFWPTERDLRIHYKRYENQKEFPKILRIATADMFEVNTTKPQFCRLNSGAPRCSSYYSEGAPPRGPQSFQYAEDYAGTPSSIREVTFEGSCNLPNKIWMSDHPNSSYHMVVFN